MKGWRWHRWPVELLAVVERGHVKAEARSGEKAD